MALPELGDYALVGLVLQRGLGLVYLVAFLVTAFQFRPLAGEDGLVPIERFVAQHDPRTSPSLFHWFPSDRATGLAAWLGVGLALLATLGVPDLLGTPATVLVWLVLWALYLSFVNAGGPFYGYGWESMLLESGFLAVLLGASGVGPPDVVVWLFRWLLFRMMFGSGLIKLRADPCWRDLTCLEDHYETQPMPNPASWHAHHLPPPVHRLGVLGNHVVELGLPFLFFAPQPYAAAAGTVTIAFQGWLILTGNFSWWNWLTALVAVSTFSDGMLTAALPVSAPGVAPAPPFIQVAAVVVALVVGFLSVRPVGNLLSERQRMNTSYDPLRLVNSYGAFGSITADRFQLVVEGTHAPDPAEGDWEAYEFAGQPLRPGERPPQVAPYHRRLDWQLWFAAMRPSPGRRHAWFVELLARLLEADDAVLRLLGRDPFDGEPPSQVRAVRYRYWFTTPAERAETGRWWRRERVGTYVPPVTQSDLRGGRTGRHPT